MTQSDNRHDFPAELIKPADVTLETLGRMHEQVHSVVWPDSSKRFCELLKIWPHSGPPYYLLRAGGPELLAPLAISFPKYHKTAAIQFALKCTVVLATWHVAGERGSPQKFAAIARDLFYGTSVRDLTHG